MRINLKVVEGYRADRGRIVTVERDAPDNITFGRATGGDPTHEMRRPHIQLSEEDLRLSRWHFMLMIRPPDCFLHDLGSANHTYLNDFDPDHPITQAVPLGSGDRIRAGRTMFAVEIVPGESSEDRPQLPAGDPAAVEPDRAGAGGVAPPDPARGAPNPASPRRAVPAASPARKELLFRWGERDRSQLAADSFHAESRREQVAVRCHGGCGADLAESAAGDDFGPELSDGALYLCQDCARKMKKRPKKLKEYELLRELGRGGMGVVHLGRHSKSARLVAIKELSGDGRMNEHSLRVFKREIEVAEELRHPNIVRFYETFSKRKRPFLVTEYLPGGSAEDRIAANGKRLPLPQALAVTTDILEGLAYAHRKGFVHRDIKPQNILFDSTNRAKLSDLGLAKSFELAGNSGITNPDNVGGTLHYMAPEQLTDFLHVRPPADVYSVGVCLYRFLSGGFPFEFPSPQEVFQGLVGLRSVRHPCSIILEDDPVPIAERWPGVPSGIAVLIDRCLQRSPADRFADAEALQKALQAAV
ncbi:MAG: protein kinase [Candidatus Eisenbacteria bacterium]|nr:protein kinase [Candidatus Eisenbacteria bacterium]